MTIEIIESPATTVESETTQVVVETTATAPLNVTVEEGVTTVEIVHEDEVTIEISAGPKGDRGPSGNPEIPAEADAVIKAGQPLYVKSTTHVDLARADSLPTSRVAGLATAAAAVGFEATFVTDGTLALDDWTDATGSASLVPGSVYYLSQTAGRLTTVPPEATGSYVTPVGRAINTRTFDLTIDQPIGL